MKKPDKVIQWLHIDRKPFEPFLNHRGKPLYKYSIELPYWIVAAYNPFEVKVEVTTEKLCYVDRIAQTNKEEIQEYVKANWSKKLTKMRKINNNYMMVSTVAISKSFFKSMEDYENYHSELNQLNIKYCLSPSTSTKGGDEKP